jgi:anaerobic glycerol-3-phosphate dehydrogenase
VALVLRKLRRIVCLPHLHPCLAGLRQEASVGRRLMDQGMCRSHPSDGLQAQSRRTRFQTW